MSELLHYIYYNFDFLCRHFNFDKCGLLCHIVCFNLIILTFFVIISTFCPKYDLINYLCYNCYLVLTFYVIIIFFPHRFVFYVISMALNFDAFIIILSFCHKSILNYDAYHMSHILS